MEASSFPLFSQEVSNIVGISPSPSEGELIVTSATKGVQIFNVHDQKCVKSWSLKQNIKPTLPCIFSKESNHFFGVSNNTLFSFSATTQNPTINEQKYGEKIVYLLNSPYLKNQLIIFFSNGTGAVVGSNLQIYTEFGDKSAQPGKVQWAKHLSNGVLIAYQWTSQRQREILSYKLGPSSKFFPLGTFILPFEEKNPVSLSCDINGSVLNEIKEDGMISFKTFNYKEGMKLESSKTALLDIPNMRQGGGGIASNGSSMSILVFKKENKILVVVWDITYSVVQGMHTLQVRSGSENDAIVQVVLSEDKSWIAVLTTSGISICKLYIPASSLASVLSKAKETNLLVKTTATEQLTLGSVNLSRTLNEFFEEKKKNKKSGIISVEFGDEVTWKSAIVGQEKEERGLKALTDPLATPTEADFLRVFDNHTAFYKQFSPNFVWALTNRCISSKFFVPLEFLLSKGMITASLNPELIPFLIKEEKIELLEFCLQNMADLNATLVIDILKFFLKAGRNKSLYKLLNDVVKTPVSFIFLHTPTRRLTLDELQIFLRYLVNKFAKLVDGTRKPSRHSPSMDNVISWLNLIVDVHFAQLVLVRKFHRILFSLLELVKQEKNLSGQLEDLSGYLYQFMKKKELPKPMTVDYTIEAIVF